MQALKQLINAIQWSCLLFISIQTVKAQTIGSASDSLSKETEMTPGYIILENHTDTLWGLIAIETKDSMAITGIKFKENGKTKIQKYGGGFKNEVRFFGTKTKKCRYVNWVDENIPTKFYQQHPTYIGWVMVIEEGKIAVSVGFEKQAISNQPPNSGGIPLANQTIQVPVFCLKKEGVPLALIKGKADYKQRKRPAMLCKLDETNQLYLVDLMKDDLQVAVKIEYGEITFEDALRAIQEYNKRVKEKK